MPAFFPTAEMGSWSRETTPWPLWDVGSSADDGLLALRGRCPLPDQPTVDPLETVHSDSQGQETGSEYSLSDDGGNTPSPSSPTAYVGENNPAVLYGYDQPAQAPVAGGFGACENQVAPL